MTFFKYLELRHQISLQEVQLPTPDTKIESRMNSPSYFMGQPLIIMPKPRKSNNDISKQDSRHVNRKDIGSKDGISSNNSVL
jgi:hypothetical protein